MGTARRSTIYLDPELHRRVRLAGADGDRTISDLVNAAVAHFLAAGGADADTTPAPAHAAAPPSAPTEPGATVRPATTAAPALPAAAAPAAAPAGLPAFLQPPAPVPVGLAPPVRRLFGALRPADADAAESRDARLARHGA